MTIYHIWLNPFDSKSQRLLGMKKRRCRFYLIWANYFNPSLALSRKSKLMSIARYTCSSKECALSWWTTPSSKQGPRQGQDSNQVGVQLARDMMNVVRTGHSSPGLTSTHDYETTAATKLRWELATPLQVWPVPPILTKPQWHYDEMMMEPALPTPDTSHLKPRALPTRGQSHARHRNIQYK